MIQRNRSACKNVKIFTPHIGSKGAPRRGTVFFRGTNTKSREVSNMECGNTKTSIIQKRGAGFKAAIDLNKEECIKELSTQTYNNNNIFKVVIVVQIYILIF
jgi:hypothetical protein